MQLISVIYRSYRSLINISDISVISLSKISASSIGQNIIGDIDRYLTDITDISPI
ncbi:hypothetical protein HanPSC8_Chr15g0692611 [Helianthus annuus]|nr:hypothetical protein HanPSC8_Chr15g0692611 [Helianthus annuus]